MSYCTVADIQNDFKTITFASSGFITSAAVTQFIVEAQALIDSYVGSRWVTPITADVSSLALMSLYCRTLVSARVRGILANKQTTNADGNQNAGYEGLSVKDIMNGLVAIQQGNMQLSGATLLLQGGGFFSNNQQSGLQPRFQKSRRQW